MILIYIISDFGRKSIQNARISPEQDKGKEVKLETKSNPKISRFGTGTRS